MDKFYSKNDVAPVPPMGWNSYDYYNTLVNEEQVRANADYMAKNLKKHGWEYVVIDIQWSDENAGKQNGKGVQYIPFSHFCLDEYSRQIPAVNRFPSAANGAGFKPLADYIHSLGLKFGIHIMRGISRFAAHNHLPIKTHDGSKVTADQIANAYSTCAWNPDMYGVDFRNPYAQDYYDSIFELYAEWGVDFVKVDDICRHVKEPIYENEVKMMAKAIQNSGRGMVLSLSPGPAVIEKAHLYETYANMWRITDDFWDKWELLKPMFERCEVWQKHSGEGNWPDCDMIPLNVLGYGWADANAEHKGWKCNFTQAESRTMVSLWSIVRSPLMIGTDLPQLDDFSLSLITNDEILSMNKNPNQARLSYSDENLIEWVQECDDNSYYAAYFNVGEEEKTVKINLITEENQDNQGEPQIRDLWNHKNYGAKAEFKIPKHDCLVVKIS